MQDFESGKGKPIKRMNADQENTTHFPDRLSVPLGFNFHMPIILIPIFFILLYLFGEDATLNTPVIQAVFFATSFIVGIVIGVIQKTNCYKHSLIGIAIVAIVYAAYYAPTHSLWVVGLAFLSIPFFFIFFGIFISRLVSKKYFNRKSEHSKRRK